jgi:hypothetical protein
MDTITELFLRILALVYFLALFVTARSIKERLEQILRALEKPSSPPLIPKP